MLIHKLLLHNKRFPFFRFLTITLLYGSFISACVMLKKSTLLPPTDIECPISFGWNGIYPGKSSQQDVVDALGEPHSKGRYKFGNSYIPFYAYSVEGGVISEYVQDRFFFRSDGVVDWIENIVADRDGEFHEVEEIVDQLGSTLDMIYVNSNYDPSLEFQYDVLEGPDQIYVWSECGLALVSFIACSPNENGGVKCDVPDYLVDPDIPAPNNFTLRWPKPYPGSLDPSFNTDNAILMKYLFQPTTYNAFSEFYMHKIPFGIWDEFLRRVAQG